MNSLAKSEKKTSSASLVSSLLTRLGGTRGAVVVIAVGVLLIIISSLLGGESVDVERDEVEAKLEEMCSSLEGVGECRVMVTYEESSGRYGSSDVRRVESVAVVCRGADRASVRSEITSMISALYGIGANRIFISRMK